MTLLLRKAALGRALNWIQRVLFICAVLLLGYCGFALVDSWNFQRRESRELEGRLRHRPAVTGNTSQPASRRFPKAAPVRINGLIGRLEIPRILLSAVVVEGIGSTVLRRAVGHIPGTALPGQPGNVGLSGHRDTFFRPLKDLRIRDEIRFSTPDGDFEYEVESLDVVEPDNVKVLAPSAGNVMTMVTCYPFYYVGPAPKRWIVKARQVLR